MGLFGGGSSTTVVNTSNVSVAVNPDIENTVIVDDSRLQAMIDKIAEGNETAAAISLATAKTQSDIAKAQLADTQAAREQSNENLQEIFTWVKQAAIAAVVGYFGMRLLKGARL